MGLKKSHSFQVNYKPNTDYRGLQDQYDGVLSEDQLNAIKTPITKSFDVEDCYYKVDYLEGCKDGLIIRLGVYTDETAEKLITQLSYSFKPSVNIESSNFIRQTYFYLKSLPEFETAIDC